MLSCLRGPYLPQVARLELNLLDSNSTYGIRNIPIGKLTCHRVKPFVKRNLCPKSGDAYPRQRSSRDVPQGDSVHRERINTPCTKKRRMSQNVAPFCMDSVESSRLLYLEFQTGVGQTPWVCED